MIMSIIVIHTDALVLIVADAQYCGLGKYVLNPPSLCHNYVLNPPYVY
jgi:hypothetical protein